MQIRQNMTTVCEWFLFLLLQGKWQRAIHLSGSFHVPERVRYKIKKQYWVHRLLTIGLKMCEFRCWGCGATDEGCWWLAAPVGGVAGFCCRSSLGGGGSGRDGGWGSGTTKCKVADKMLHNTVKSRYYVRVLCIFHYFMHFCTQPMPKRTSSLILHFPKFYTTVGGPHKNLKSFYCNTLYHYHSQTCNLYQVEMLNILHL